MDAADLHRISQDLGWRAVRVQSSEHSGVCRARLPWVSEAVVAHERWEETFPPYTIRAEFLFWEAGHERVACAEKEEVLRGFKAGHAPAWADKRQRRQTRDCLNKTEM